ncbi:MAG: hypothetical protein H6736_23645 [Alphaproteobacteria bacterium]|nr:hypothetical protein [Alphaproteobacteria bacterium]
MRAALVVVMVGCSSAADPNVPAWCADVDKLDGGAWDRSVASTGTEIRNARDEVLARETRYWQGTVETLTVVLDEFDRPTSQAWEVVDGDGVTTYALDLQGTFDDEDTIVYTGVEERDGVATDVVVTSVIDRENRLSRRTQERDGLLTDDLTFERYDEWRLLRSEQLRVAYEGGEETGRTVTVGSYGWEGLTATVGYRQEWTQGDQGGSGNYTGSETYTADGRLIHQLWAHPAENQERTYWYEEGTPRPKEDLFVAWDPDFPNQPITTQKVYDWAPCAP